MGLNILGLGLKMAESFIPGVNVILSGASIVGGIIGGETGAKIQQGVDLLQGGLGAVGKTPLTPEQQFQLEQAKQTTQIELAKIDLQREELPYQDQAGGREIIRTESQSEDPVVRQARPKMMVLVGKTALVYTVCTPFLVVGCILGHAPKELLDALVTLILYQGGTLWTAFMAAFTGYTVARSVDKKTANGLDVSGVMQAIAGIGKKIS